MPDRSPEVFAQALLDNAIGHKSRIFPNRATAEGYLLQLYVVLHDDAYPHGCASEIMTRLQGLTEADVTVQQIAECKTLAQLKALLYPNS